jgi:hypothetical protein
VVKAVEVRVLFWAPFPAHHYLLNRACPVFPAAVFSVKAMAAPGAIGFFASAFIRKLDFHGASLAAKAHEQLAECEALLDAFAQQVFDAQDENRPPGRTGRRS